MEAVDAEDPARVAGGTDDTNKSVEGAPDEFPFDSDAEKTETEIIAALEMTLSRLQTNDATFICL